MGQQLMSMTSKPLIRLPLLPLRDVVVYPHMVIPLCVGRKQSIEALKLAMASSAKEKEILLVAQKNPEDKPTKKDFYQVGTIAKILCLIKLPDGTFKVLVEGIERAEIKEFFEEDSHIMADIQIAEIAPVHSDKELECLAQGIYENLGDYNKLTKKIPEEILKALSGISDRGHFTDMVAAHLSLTLQEKQSILEAFPIKTRLEKLLTYLGDEIGFCKIQQQIRGRVRSQIEKSQREYYLNEQIKAIQKELGESQGATNELEVLAKRIQRAKMPKEAKAKALSELNKLKSMSPMAAEATVSRNYLDWILSLPWNCRSKVSYDLDKAQEILKEAHYGLEKVKERVIEFLAVHQRVKKLKGPILCLVGPPGVGKTSLGQSIAKAIDRNFVRMSLGGVRDEAEIRGHRRTYIGSMPGRIMQKIAKVGVKNPLFMLDEIDKMAMDFRGDPAAALLEVLDPEQNSAFDDHYLEVSYDLSEVLFIATANTLTIPPALLDRMEVIRIPGYTEDEKISIAKQHLLPKQLNQSGLKTGPKNRELLLSEDTLQDIIRYYTREAGVRGLERDLAKICRKVVTEIARNPDLKSITVTRDNLEKYLGVRQFRYGLAEQRNQVGQVSGLAWTEVGGDLLTIEAAIIPGKGKTSYTGHLGEVMQESIQAALTVVRSRAKGLNIPVNFYEKKDIHVHVPEGATPKDGPSAGIGMCTALVSAVTKVPVRADVAMTGEITLRGEVLPIGGLKEKLLAAHRGGIREVIIPEENERDLKEIPENIKEGLIIHPVRWIDQVLDIALQQPLRQPLPHSSTMKKKKKLAPIKLVSRKGQQKTNSITNLY